MAKARSKPLISGGHTLSKMYQGKKDAGGGKTRKKRKSWFEDGGQKFSERIPCTAYLEGQMPPDVVAVKKETGEKK